MDIRFEEMIFFSIILGLVSEVSGAEKVAFLRSEMENFVGLSFATIRLFHVVARK